MNESLYNNIALCKGGAEMAADIQGHGESLAEHAHCLDRAGQISVYVNSRTRLSTAAM